MSVNAAQKLSNPSSGATKLRKWHKPQIKRHIRFARGLYSEGSFELFQALNAKNRIVVFQTLDPVERSTLLRALDQNGLVELFQALDPSGRPNFFYALNPTCRSKLMQAFGFRATRGFEKELFDELYVNAYHEYVIAHNRSLPTYLNLSEKLSMRLDIVRRIFLQINNERKAQGLPMLEIDRERRVSTKQQKETDTLAILAFQEYADAHDGKPPTLAELGKILEVTRERARQILKRVNKERKAKGLSPLLTIRQAKKSMN